MVNNLTLTSTSGSKEPVAYEAAEGLLALFGNPAIPTSV